MRVPRVLQPFMMGMEFMPFVKPKPSDMAHQKSEAGQKKAEKGKADKGKAKQDKSDEKSDS